MEKSVVAQEQECESLMPQTVSTPQQPSTPQRRPPSADPRIGPEGLRTKFPLESMNN